MTEKYAEPTLEDLKKDFKEGKVGRPIKVISRKNKDAQQYIAKLEKAYETTKNTSIHFG